MPKMNALSLICCLFIFASGPLWAASAKDKASLSNLSYVESYLMFSIAGGIADQAWEQSTEPTSERPPFKVKKVADFICFEGTNEASVFHVCYTAVAGQGNLRTSSWKSTSLFANSPIDENLYRPSTLVTMENGELAVAADQILSEQIFEFPGPILINNEEKMVKSVGIMRCERTFKPASGLQGLIWSLVGGREHTDVCYATIRAK